MKLELWAGKKKIMEFVQAYKNIAQDGRAPNLERRNGYFAIPGCTVHTEKTVRKWASDFGYYIIKQYEQEDIDDETLCDAGS